MNDDLKKVKVNVPKRSGFDHSFRNVFSAPIGTIVPIVNQEVIPGSKIDLSVAAEVNLPPLASNFYGNVDLALEAFYVPYRQLYGGFTSWLTGEQFPNQVAPGNNVTAALPHIELNSGTTASLLGPGSLADYLGVKIQLNNGTTNPYTGTKKQNINLFPFMAYHWIYDNWYRKTDVQKPLFYRPVGQRSSAGTVNNLATLPYIVATSANSTQTVLLDDVIGNSSNTGLKLGSLHQRNFGSDYFTLATTSAQVGSPNQVSMTTTNINTSVSSTNATGNTTLTIAALRAANALQMYKEKQNLVGYKYQDYLKVNWNAYLNDGIANIPVYLGSKKVPIYTKGVYQTSSINDSGRTDTKNPFGGVAGSAFGVMNGSETGIHLVDNFEVNEPGIVMVLATLVPRVAYSNGIARNMLHFNSTDSQSDIANCTLQAVGQQPIYTSEVNPYYTNQPNQVFGYTDRYAEYMTHSAGDEVHGLLREGQSLSYMCLQRTNSTGVTSINSNFLRIPEEYLDGVAAANYDISDYGYWCDSYITCHIAAPLTKYMLPTLQDPAAEHGEEVFMKRGGNRID